MPELAEVETIVRKLKPKIEHQTIQKLIITDSKVVPYDFSSKLPLTIKTIKRKGKYILLECNKDTTLIIHLRMTGHFNYYPSSPQPTTKKYLAATLELNDGSFLTFHEIRRFGRILCYSHKEANRILSKIGPDPLEITANQFVQILNTSPQSNIKSKLLDQNAISGIGNIYAQEALYHAAISPLARIQQIPQKKQVKLHAELNRILKLAIAQNGTTIQNYSHLDGKGNFQQFLSVYQKEKCPRNHILEKIKIATRTTSYCPICQR